MTTHRAIARFNPVDVTWPPDDHAVYPVPWIVLPSREVVGYEPVKAAQASHLIGQGRDH
ncbi:hypothetical protein GCM10028802_39560 [Terrabacter terrigena]